MTHARFRQEGRVPRGVPGLSCYRCAFDRDLRLIDRLASPSCGPTWNRTIPFTGCPSEPAVAQCNSAAPFPKPVGTENLSVASSGESTASSRRSISPTHHSTTRTPRPPIHTPELAMWTASTSPSSAPPLAACPTQGNAKEAPGLRRPRGVAQGVPHPGATRPSKPDAHARHQVSCRDVCPRIAR